MSQSVVAVSAQSLFLAQSKIQGCINCCSDRASIRFERVLDTITGMPDTTTYILPALAICPACYNHVVESTLVLTSNRAPKRKTATRSQQQSTGEIREKARGYDGKTIRNYIEPE